MIVDDHWQWNPGMPGPRPPEPLADVRRMMADATNAAKAAKNALDGPQGAKFDAGKPKYSLLPSGVLGAVVRVLTFGARKYAPGNWKKVESERYYDALWRHVEAFRNGEQIDPESGEHHLSHAICCLMFMQWLDLNPPGKS